MENSENFKKVVTILAKYKNTDKFKVRVGKNGIGFSIHRDVNDELMKSDIPKNEIENINKKILDVITDLLPRLIEQNPSDFVVFPSVSEGKFKIASQFYNRNKVAES